MRTEVSEEIVLSRRITLMLKLYYGSQAGLLQVAGLNNQLPVQCDFGNKA